jgi:hypothetical protein
MWVLLGTSVNKIQNTTISPRQEERNYAQLLRMLTGRDYSSGLNKTSSVQDISGARIAKTSEFNKLELFNYFQI